MLVRCTAAIFAIACGTALCVLSTNEAATHEEAGILDPVPEPKPKQATSGYSLMQQTTTRGKLHNWNALAGTRESRRVGWWHLLLSLALLLGTAIACAEPLRIFDSKSELQDGGSFMLPVASVLPRRLSATVQTETPEREKASEKQEASYVADYVIEHEGKSSEAVGRQVKRHFCMTSLSAQVDTSKHPKEPNNQQKAAKRTVFMSSLSAQVGRAAKRTA